MGVATGAALGGATGYFYGGPVGAAVGFAGGAIIGAAGVSPRRIDAGVRSMFASGGTQTESYLNPFVDGVQHTKNGPMDVVRSMPIVGSMANRFLGGTTDARLQELDRQFYDRAQDALQVRNTYENLIKTDPQKANAYAQQNKNDMFVSTLALASYSSLSDLKQAEAAIMANPKLTDEQKNNATARAHERRLDILEKGIAAMKRTPQGTGATSPLGPGGVR